jgi:glutaredoxin
MLKSVTTWLASFERGRQPPEPADDFDGILAQGASAPLGRATASWKWCLLFRFLRSFFGRRRLEHLRFIFYTRQGCHLCEDAWLLLQREQQRYHYELEVVDIDSQQELKAQFGEQVPVVMVNGQIRFRGRINAVLLTRLLRAEIRHSSE